MGLQRVGHDLQLNKNSINARASQVALVVKNLPINAGDIKDVGLTPVSGRSLEVEMATHSSILVWRIPWIEEP